MSNATQTVEVMVEAAAVMGFTYAVVRGAYVLARDLASSPHWKSPSWGVWIGIWVVVGSMFFGETWATDHVRNCDQEYPAARFMDRTDPGYSIVRWCKEGNRAQTHGRMLAVLLVLGISSFSGVQKGQEGPVKG